jgi:hypothetical protein
MRYYYDRYWGIFYADDFKSILGCGYSGHRLALNDITKQAEEGIGPLPAGTYTISEVYDDPKRGKHTLRLTPDPGTKMFGRSGFLVHGDLVIRTHEASDGCIVTSLSTRLLFNLGDEIVVL